MARTEQVAVVTGASQGIGRGVAEALLADGHRVALVARRCEPLEALAATHPDQALPIAADVSDPQAVDRIYEQVASQWGRVDVLFNNAGAFMASSETADVSYDDWRRVLGATAGPMTSPAARSTLAMPKPPGPGP